MFLVNVGRNEFSFKWSSLISCLHTFSLTLVWKGMPINTHIAYFLILLCCYSELWVPVHRHGNRSQCHELYHQQHCSRGSGQVFKHVHDSLHILSTPHCMYRNGRKPAIHLPHPSGQGHAGGVLKHVPGVAPGGRHWDVVESVTGLAWGSRLPFEPFASCVPNKCVPVLRLRISGNMVS